MEYIPKSALVVEIEKRIHEYAEKADIISTINAHLSSQYSALIVECGDILSFINTLEVKEVDLEKEIQNHIKECLDIKFPTTDVKLIKKDVVYTAKKFFELGLKSQRGE